MTTYLRTFAAYLGGALLTGGLTLAFLVAVAQGPSPAVYPPTDPTSALAIALLPEAPPATPVQVPAFASGDEHREGTPAPGPWPPARGCTEDELLVTADFQAIGPMEVCLHIEGDGWRVKP